MMSDKEAKALGTQLQQALELHGWPPECLESRQAG